MDIQVQNGLYMTYTRIVEWIQVQTIECIVQNVQYTRIKIKRISTVRSTNVTKGTDSFEPNQGKDEYKTSSGDQESSVTVVHMVFN